MIRINLLPFRAARRTENIRRQVSMFLLSLALFLLAMAYFQISLNAKISDLNDRVSSTKKELGTYKKEARKVDSIKRKLDNLQKRTNVMVKLDKNRKEPVFLLNEMTKIIIPNRMWLKNMKVSGRRVSISGVAMDNRTTADFMVRLEQSNLFQSVRLQSVRHTMIKNRKMKKFNISFLITPLNKRKKDKAEK